MNLTYVNADNAVRMVLVYIWFACSTIAGPESNSVIKSSPLFRAFDQPYLILDRCIAPTDCTYLNEQYFL